MNDLLREEVEKEIHELNSNLAEINDGIELSKLIASEVLKITQSFMMLVPMLECIAFLLPLLANQKFFLLNLKQIIFKCLWKT